MIDRSKPLQIHEFPSLISEVAKLQDLYQKHLPETPPGSLRYTTEFCQAGINALPKLLDVLGEIRVGDEENMEYCIRWLETTNINKICIDMLRRYRDMARKMDGNR